MKRAISGYSTQILLGALCLIFVLMKLPYLSHYVLWDEAVYIGMGKYIYSAGASGLWEMIRPLGLPFITGFWWLLGLDPLIASRVFALLVSVGFIVTTYLIGKELFDKRTALLAAFLLAFTPVFFYYAEYVMTDHISALLMYLAIFFIIRRNYVAAGILGGLAFFFKFTHVLFIFGALLYMAYAYRKKYPKAVYWLALSFVFVALYFALNFMLYHSHFSLIDSVLRPYLDAAAYQNNPYQNVARSTMGQWLFSFVHSLYNIVFNRYFGFLALAAFFLVPLVRKQIRGEKHLVLLGFFVIYLVHSAIIPYKNERFFVFLLPVIVIYAAAVYMHLLRKGTVARVASGAFIGISLVFVAQAMFVFPSWYDASSPDMRIERYFDDRNISGPIVITSPHFTAYSDERYVPAYDILNKNGLFVNDWEANTSFEAAAYDDKSVPCFETDVQCLENKAALEHSISRLQPRDSYAYNGANVTFYTR